MGATRPGRPGNADMHPEQIKASVRMTGVSLTQLAELNGYSECAVRRALRHPWPAVEAIVARQIGLRPEEIWPSRYNRDGSPRSRSYRTENRPGRHRRHRQIETRALT